MFRGTECGTGTSQLVEIAMFHAEQERSKTPFLFRVPPFPFLEGRGAEQGAEQSEQIAVDPASRSQSPGVDEAARFLDRRKRNNGAIGPQPVGASGPTNAKKRGRI